MVSSANRAGTVCLVREWQQSASMLREGPDGPRG